MRRMWLVGAIAVLASGLVAGAVGARVGGGTFGRNDDDRRRVGVRGRRCRGARTHAGGDLRGGRARCRRHHRHPDGGHPADLLRAVAAPPGGRARVGFRHRQAGRHRHEPARRRGSVEHPRRVLRRRAPIPRRSSARIPRPTSRSFACTCARRSCIRSSSTTRAPWPSVTPCTRSGIPSASTGR